jgi:hypothetical protein
MTATQWLEHYWGWVVFWCVVLGVPGSVAEFCRRALRTRHKRRVQLAKARRVQPDPSAWTARHSADRRSLVSCAHLKVVPVRTGGGDLVGWVCANPVCGKQFPPESAVLAEEEVDPE